MSLRAPPWAITADAIDGVGDTHLPAGFHIRALPSPLLGLPATPLFIYRTVLKAAVLHRAVRSTGVTWVDSNGAVLTPPFDVTADNPVTGYFPSSNILYAELDGTAADIVVVGPVSPVSPVTPVTPVHPVVPVTPGHPVITAAPADPGGPVIAASAPPIDVTLPVGLRRKAAFRFEALAATPLGPAPVQSRSGAPYQLAGWTIAMVRVVGHGTVNGIAWADISALKGVTEEEKPIAIWSLPVAPAPRYTPTPNAAAEAKDRIARTAATRQPLYVAYDAASPAAAPAATSNDALKRVEQVRQQTDKWLKEVLNDMSVEPWEVSDAQTLSGSAGGTATVPIEPFLISGAVDPDVGHYMGFGDIDERAAAETGDIVIYRVRGAWRWVPDRWTAPQALLLSAGVQKDLDTLIKGFPELKAQDLVPKQTGAYADLSANAAMLAGIPPDVPPVPAPLVTSDRGWLATPPPPDVRRAVRLQADSFRPHPVAALAATDADGLRTLHAFPQHGRIRRGEPLPTGTPLPLIVSRPQDATAPGQGRFEDRDAPAGAIAYHLAQGDWFGRWGNWALGSAPDKARTPPARPTIEIYPQPPIVPTPVPDGPLAGQITLRIPIPRIDALPPGGAALASLDLGESFGGASSTSILYDLTALSGAVIEPHPAPDHDVLVITRSGPALERCASTKVAYIARWNDALGRVSTDSDPAVRTITDPRPPLPPVVPTELRYTARPDAQGHARADLTFASVPGTRYRIFVSTETTLLKSLDSRGETAAAAAIRAADAGAPRATVFKSFKHLFDWDDFEGLTKDSLLATGPSTPFAHRFSGSLEVLALYRILGEGPSGHLSEMHEADLIPFAVPNLGAPPRPQAAILNVGLDPMTAGVRLRVRVPIGRAPAIGWRLRRSSGGNVDPLAMNLVASGPVTDAESDSEATTFDIAATEPLKPWRRYRFAVEVQAGPPPGAPTASPIPPGEWSAASATVPVATVPAAAPVAPSAVSIAAAAGGLQVVVTYPQADGLLGTVLGAFQFDYWRVVPGQRPTKRDLVFVRGAGETWSAFDADQPDDIVPPPTGTYASVRIIDPIGRRGDATVSNLL